MTTIYHIFPNMTAITPIPFVYRPTFWCKAAGGQGSGVGDQGPGGKVKRYAVRGKRLEVRGLRKDEGRWMREDGRKVDAF